MQNKHTPKEVTSTPDFPVLENELLQKWYSTGIVEKYLHKNDDSKEKFYFQDGPITANNPMGVHHAWGRTYKDLWQRYHNMLGHKQRFQNGFDCQGLWVEVEVEKDLGFRSKKDIEQFGVEKFIDACKNRVHKFSAIQTEQSKRLGYFMDWDNSYYTMSDENNYTIWNFLQVCHQKGWVYKGHDSVPWCPRCETAISQHEMLTEDYKEVTHKSIVLQLPLLNNEKEYLLVWTTTPWTIPANIAVAVDTKLEYCLVEGQTGNRYYLAKNAIDRIFKDSKPNILKILKGEDLVGETYTGPFDSLEVVKSVSVKSKLFHTVIATDSLIMPISSEEGTGLVHTAVSAGTEDFRLGQKLGLPMIPVIADNADYLPGLGFLSGKNAKKHPEIIFDYLVGREENGENWVFSIENYSHRYPACWRCKTELVWKVADEWYIAMDKNDPTDKDKRTLRQKMIGVAKKITWLPEFGLDRELDWLQNMHDWLISKKNRYWGLALPIWVCEKCQKFDVVGSKDELRKRATRGFEAINEKSPHRPQIDQIKLTCQCSGEMTRVSDVGNPWLDAGIVTFSTLLDPITGKPSYLHDKKYWSEWFPADFITESFPGQFKNWFYSLIAMSTVLTDTNPFKTVLGFASVLGEDGRAMHKSWGNSIEFNEAADKIGVDVMRWTFANHNPERNLLFGFRLTSETKRLFHMILWNSFRFFVNYASLENWSFTKSPPNLTELDRWVLMRLEQTRLAVTDCLDHFNAYGASDNINAFVQDLSTWYVRRSRSRVGPAATDSQDKQACYSTLHVVFDCLSRLLMPFTPFLSDLIYTNVTGQESVHLSDWPREKIIDIDEQLIGAMAKVRLTCEKAHGQRKTAAIPVKQILATLTITGQDDYQNKYPQLPQIIEQEINVEKVVFTKSDSETITLDLNLTDQLIAKGKVREIIRDIQQKRKETNCRLDERVDITYPDWPEEFEDEIKRRALINNLDKGAFTLKRLESIH